MEIIFSLRLCIPTFLMLKFDGHFSDLAIFTAINFQNTDCNDGNDNVSDKKDVCFYEYILNLHIFPDWNLLHQKRM